MCTVYTKVNFNEPQASIFQYHAQCFCSQKDVNLCFTEENTTHKSMRMFINNVIKSLLIKLVKIKIKNLTMMRQVLTLMVEV